MAQLTRKQTEAIYRIIANLSRGMEFLASEEIVVGRRLSGSIGNARTLAFTNDQGENIVPLDKQVGIDITSFQVALRDLRNLADADGAYKRSKASVRLAGSM